MLMSFAKTTGRPKSKRMIKAAVVKTNAALVYLVIPFRLGSLFAALGIWDRMAI